jgi:hypothetical protein
MEKIQNCVVFRSSAFNTTVPRDYFKNPSCFGDDAARWIMVELGIRGFQTGAEPTQEDFGWGFTFEAAGTRHHVVLGYRPVAYGGEGEWICWVERKVGSLGAILKMTKKIKPEAVQAIQDVLSSSPAMKVAKFCDVREL